MQRRTSIPAHTRREQLVWNKNRAKEKCREKKAGNLGGGGVSWEQHMD